MNVKGIINNSSNYVLDMSTKKLPPYLIRISPKERWESFHKKDLRKIVTINFLYCLFVCFFRNIFVWNLSTIPGTVQVIIVGTLFPLCKGGWIEFSKFSKKGGGGQIFGKIEGVLLKKERYYKWIIFQKKIYCGK